MDDLHGRAEGRSVRSCSRTVLLIPEKWLYGKLIDNIDPDRRTVIRGHHVEASISIHLKQDHATNGEEMQFSLTRFKERCVVSLTQKSTAVQSRDYRLAEHLMFTLSIPR